MQTGPYCLIRHPGERGKSAEVVHQDASTLHSLPPKTRCSTTALSCHAGHAGSIVGILGYAGFVGLRPPGLLWALVLVLPLSFFMVGCQEGSRSAFLCLNERQSTSMPAR